MTTDLPCGWPGFVKRITQQWDSIQQSQWPGLEYQKELLDVSHSKAPKQTCRERFLYLLCDSEKLTKEERGPAPEFPQLTCLFSPFPRTLPTERPWTGRQTWGPDSDPALGGPRLVIPPHVFLTCTVRGFATTLSKGTSAVLKNYFIQVKTPPACDLDETREQGLWHWTAPPTDSHFCRGCSTQQPLRAATVCACVCMCLCICVSLCVCM